MKNIFELRSFLFLWSSQTVSELGTAMTSYALIIWVYEQKTTASSITLLTICSFLPTIKVIFITTAFIFAGNIVQSLSYLPLVWCIAAFASYIPAVIMNANLTTIMREHIPSEMQGRVFSAKDTLQNCTIPLGLFLGGVLADYVMEPFMAAGSPVQEILSHFFGSGNGSGIAVMFFCAGILGITISLTRLRKPIYKDLNI